MNVLEAWLRISFSQDPKRTWAVVVAPVLEEEEELETEEERHRTHQELAEMQELATMEPHPQAPTKELEAPNLHPKVVEDSCHYSNPRVSTGVFGGPWGLDGACGHLEGAQVEEVLEE